MREWDGAGKPASISGSPVTVTDPSGRPLRLAHRAASDRGGRVAEPGEGLAGALLAVTNSRRRFSTAFATKSSSPGGR